MLADLLTVHLHAMRAPLLFLLSAVLATGADPLLGPYSTTKEVVFVPGKPHPVAVKAR